MMIDLKSINVQYETIVHSDISRDEKDKAYTNLVTYMEAHYDIPMLQKAEFEADNSEIIALYQKISTSRTTNRRF